MFSCSYESCTFKSIDNILMENHTVCEHGVNNKRKYKEVNIQISKKFKVVKKRGQTSCSMCGKSFNNRSKPVVCICGNLLKKSCQSDSKISTFQLNGEVYSVRKYRKGISKRVVVNLASNICFSEDCLEARAHFDDFQKFNCAHLKACSDLGNIEKADKLKISINKVLRYVQCEKIKREVKKVTDSENMLTVFHLPDGNIVVPVFKSISHECRSGLIHIDINKLKCPVKRCSRKPRNHYLVKTRLMCIHVLLCKLIMNENSLPSSSEGVGTPPTLTPQFSKHKTVCNVLNHIREHVPSALQITQEEEFLQKSFDCQQRILKYRDLASFEAKICEICDTASTLRKKKCQRCFLVTPGYMIEVQINTYLCKTCNIILYPVMYKEGFVPIAENLIVSWSYMVEARNQVKNGTKLYHYFISSMRRLCLENEKLAPCVSQIDFHNMVVKLSKMTVAYNSVTLLRPVDDLDSLSSVLCLHCGLCPVTLMSDGNAKNSVMLRNSCDNLEFNKDDSSAIPDLDEFVMKCATSVAGTGLFQHFPKEKINVYKIPPIIGSKIVGDIHNREQLKKSSFHDEIDLSEVNFTKLEEMVTSGEFDLLKSRSLPLEKLRTFAKELKISHSAKQSKIMLENLLLELFDWLISGNSNCHKYTHSLGETGGWTDQWCPHNIKYSSKKMILQESVVDPADLYMSLLFPPLLLILDDPCTFISHMFCSETKLATKLFGANRGCFEPPHSTDPPRKDHDCPEILPLSINPRKPIAGVLKTPNSKQHPLSGTILRKVLGTRISESHKSRNQCLYHSVGNCQQAPHIKVSIALDVGLSSLCVRLGFSGGYKSM